MGEIEEVLNFCKIDANLDSNPKIRKAGRDGRDVFEFVVRRNSLMQRTGDIPLKYIEPWYLADVLMMPEDDARHGVSRAVTAALLEIDTTAGVVRIVGWTPDWGRRPMTDAERQAKRREAKKESKSNNHTPPVTENRDASREVTEVTDQRRGEEIRLEEKREEYGGGSPSASGTPPVVEPLVGSPETAPERKGAPVMPPGLKDLVVPLREGSSAKPGGGKGKAIRTHLAETWTPNQAAIDRAKLAQLDLNTERDSFVDYHAAKGSTFVDWDAAFSTWLRNAVKFRDERGGRRGSAIAPPPRDPRYGRAEPSTPDELGTGAAQLEARRAATRARLKAEAEAEAAAKQLAGGPREEALDVV